MNGSIKKNSPFIACVVALFHYVNPHVATLVLLMSIDYASGIIRAFIEKELSSDIAYKGITRKILVLLFVVSIFVFDKNLNINLHLGETVSVFYCVVELLSIMENLAASRVPIPSFLKKSLKQLMEGYENAYPKKNSPGKP